MAIKDLVGNVYGRLTVVELAGRNKHGASLWKVRCSCGTEKIICGDGLRTGNVKSCGCFRSEQLKIGRDQLHADLVTHGQTGTREHANWLQMINRCENVNHKDYPKYGGRGIKVCERWRHSFENFIADMGHRPSSDHSIDRIDNDGDYFMANCRWATRSQQQRNKRTSRLMTFQGETRNMVEWCSLLGLHKATLGNRLARGWSVENALGTPTDARFRRTGNVSSR